MGKGKRKDNHFKLAYYVMQSNGDRIDFLTLSEALNVGSNDLTYDFISTCDSVWNYCVKNYIPFDKNRSKDDRSYILNRSFRFSDDVSKRLKILIDKIIDKEFVLKKEKKKKEMYDFIRILYSKKNYKEEFKVKPRYPFLKDSISVGRKYLLDIQQYSEIKDVITLLNIFIKYFKIRRVQLENGTYYSHNETLSFAKHIYLYDIKILLKGVEGVLVNE